MLFPILRQKLQYLHAEGVAQTVWSLANAEIWDKELWEALKQQVVAKKWDCVVVKNQRWSPEYFVTLSGAEHFFERKLTKFAD